MDRLRIRPRERRFSGFTIPEIEKLEKLFEEYGEGSFKQILCQKVAADFNCSEARYSKPRVKWDNVQGWFQKLQEESLAKANPKPVRYSVPDGSQTLVVRTDAFSLKKVQEQHQPIVDSSTVLPKEIISVDDGSQSLVCPDTCCLEKVQEHEAIVYQQSLQRKEVSHLPDFAKGLVDRPDACTPKKAHEADQIPAGEKFSALSALEFEARSTRDGAWFDVDRFLAHRYLSSGEPEVLVRFSGFSAGYDEWVNVKKGVRERSVPLEHNECHKVKVGDLVLCFQENKDELLYYDARVVEILRRTHDIRGCRCVFLVRYDNDRIEQERVRLRRLCRIRPLQSMPSNLHAGNA